MGETFEQLLDQLKEKGDALAQARASHGQLEDQRPVLKEMAILRLMERDRISSNAAKDIVKTDVEYMEHCVLQRTAGVAVCRAETEYEVAKAAATRTSLITPSMIELQAKIKKLELEVKVQKQERQNAENGRANANRMLAERIDDVRALTERQRRFWESVGLITPRPGAVYDAWDSSMARIATAITGLEAAPGPHEMPGDLCATRIAGA